MHRLWKLSSLAVLSVVAICCGGADSTSSRLAADSAADAGNLSPNDPSPGRVDGGAGAGDAAGPDAGPDDVDAQAPDPDGGIDSGIRSAGCGLATAPLSGKYTIDVDGTTRSYILDVPTSYAPTHAHKLVFAWHWAGGDSTAVANGGFYGLKPLADGSTIFVAADGIDKGWYNTNGRDYALARVLVQRFEDQLCIDEQRIFSVGFSFGGAFTYGVGCEMSDVFRGVAAMSAGGGCGNGAARPVALWGAHGTNDPVINIASGRSARDAFLERNGCSTTTTPTAPSPCVSYDGCTSGYPVVWCEWDGGHATPPFSPSGIWNFFSQL